MPSLLRTEAIERAELLQVQQTKVDLDLTGPGDLFRSTTTITFGCRRPGTATFVDFKGSELIRATLNGHELAPAAWSDGRITLANLQGDNTLLVEGLMTYSSDGEGLHRHVDPADGQTYLYAMSFLDAGPRWFASFDQPDLKSPYQFEIATPDDWTVIGNGPSEQLSTGRWRIVQDRPLSTYFVTLVAGPYASVHDTHDGIRLGVHARASLAPHLEAEAADILAVTKACFDYYHRVFGIRYPFGDYHQAFVPDFNAGAMENPGCVTFRDQEIFRAAATTSERASRAGTIAHEMAHMWFGDLVTMKWWDDLWLNESFAEYMAHRACTEVTQYPLWTEFGIVRKDWGFVADQSASTHPVAGNGSADAQAALADFDGISYAKGAAVLKQLVAYLGDEVFFAGLNDYFQAHSFNNAEFADLIAAWTNAGAKGLDEWSEGWLRTAGLDTITSSREGANLKISKEIPLRHPAERTHTVAVAALDDHGQLLSREPCQLGRGGVQLPWPDGAAAVIPDAGDQTWAKIRFGDGWAGVGRLLPQITVPSIKVVIDNSIRDGVRDAQLAPAEALQLLLAQAGAEPDDVVFQSILRFAQDHLAGSFSPPQHRAERLAAIHQVARSVLASASSADLRLAAFRIAIATCADPQLLTDWLTGKQPGLGVQLDPELSWRIVVQISALGGPDLIDETLDQDRSASALVHAARARASRPTPNAKDRAFELLMKPSTASAYELYATAEGFFLDSQTELTAPFVARYFDEVAGTADFRTGWSLARVALLSYPLSHSTPETLELAEALLSRADLAGPIHRSLVDGTDRLRRAVTSRVSFAD